MPADRLISGAELRQRLAWQPLVDAIDAGHRGEPPAVERVYMEDGPNGYLVWHGWAHDSVIVTKMGTIIPGNPHGPAVQAVVVVFDATTGAPAALLDGTELTYWKTAAVSAMATRYLARSDARTLLMVGAGDLAPYLIDAHRSQRPTIDRVLVWNRTPSKAGLLAERCGGSVVTDLATACAAADVISCATAAEHPLVSGDWLRPGTHLDLVGGFTPTMREVDDAAVQRSTVFVDHSITIGEAGDLTQPLAAGVLAREAIVADLYDLATRRHPGRSDAGEVTMFKSAGGAHLDLFAARHALAVLGSD